MKTKRIWAIILGENQLFPERGWSAFADALKDTAVSFVFAALDHPGLKYLKSKMMAIIKEHRQYCSFPSLPRPLKPVLSKLSD